MKRLFTGALLCILPAVTWAQGYVFGKVTDNEGNPMTGTTVHLLGTYSGAATDIDGNYRLKVPDEGEYTLRFSWVGFETQEMTISGLTEDLEKNVTLEPATLVTGEFVVTATRATDKTPIAHSNMNKEEIEAGNIGVDLPFLLDQTPSVVVTSDAGTGIGYTGIHIRGTDATRINVTINGIPVNDAESQGVFWVNMPDFASSADNLQVQRGVGTSTNGAGAFGGTVNLQTNDLKSVSYFRTSNTYGSFNTLKNNASFGTGLINDHWTVDARLSRISSDGFIDRATSDLRSWYTSASYTDDKNSFRLNVFSGHEVTYQAWGGVPSTLLDTDRTYNEYTYDNEVDDYQQDHAQFFFTRRLRSDLTLNTALHFTHGQGFFEQFRTEDDLTDYSITPPTINDSTLNTSDLIRRRWLDNDFYGAVWSLNYHGQKGLEVIFGGGANQYEGRHFGDVIWAEYAGNSDIRHIYYDNDATKRDINFYTRANYQINNKINAFADLQYRRVNYDFIGKDAQGNDLEQSPNLNFFNPKAGVTVELNPKNRLYASVAVGNKEPNRDDFTESSPDSRPDAETLTDYELGYTFSNGRARFAANGYYMDYKDQLVPTGRINDVGAATRVNIPDSYRAGIELEGGVVIIPSLRWTGNLTLSQNRIKAFTEYIDNWDTGEQITVEHTDTDIALSPNIIGASTLTWSPLKGTALEDKGHTLDLAVLTKYVGEQFIDNTSNSQNVIDAYLVNDVRLTYNLEGFGVKAISLVLMARNILDEEYEANAWIYRYSTGDEFFFLDGYYPQAGRNYMAGLTIDF